MHVQLPFPIVIWAWPQSQSGLRMFLFAPIQASSAKTLQPLHFCVRALTPWLAHTQPTFGFIEPSSQPSFGYVPETTMARLSSKLNNATPADLPPGFAGGIAAALHSAPDDTHMQVGLQF